VCVCNLEFKLFLTILFVNPTPANLELRFNSIPFVSRSHRSLYKYRRRLAGISFLVQIYFVRYRSGPFIEFLFVCLLQLYLALATSNNNLVFFFQQLIVQIILLIFTYCKYCTREYNLIKLVNWDTCVSFRVSAPEYHRIRILHKHQCRRILAPLLSCLSGLADSFATPPKTELPATIAKRRPKILKNIVAQCF
jgi:hypothetical protein